MKYLLLTFMFLGFSCNSSKKASAEQVEKLGKYFEIHTIEGSKVNLTVKPTLILDLKEKKINGNAGCNNYSGIVLNEGDKIKFEKVFATKKYCPNTMKIEKAFMEKLRKVARFAIEENKLLLYDNSKKLLLTCKPSR